LLDSFVFFAKALIQMGLSIPDYERIFAEGRWSMEGFQRACKVLDSVPTEWFEVFEASVWCWSDGAQNDSHARIRTARSFTAGIRSRIPQSERRSVVEFMSDLLEDTATRGSFNFDGAVRTLKIDPDARESDWLKAMGDCGFESTNPQGGTFSSGPPAVGSRNGHGNAEGVASFCGFAGHDHSSSNDGTLAGFNEVDPRESFKNLAAEVFLEENPDIASIRSNEWVARNGVNACASFSSLLELYPMAGMSFHEMCTPEPTAPAQHVLQHINPIFGIDGAEEGARLAASALAEGHDFILTLPNRYHEIVIQYLKDPIIRFADAKLPKQPGQPQTSKAPKVRVAGSLPVLKKLVRVDSSNGRKVFLSNQLRSLET
jgi:hypothetical protein